MPSKLQKRRINMKRRLLSTFALAATVIGVGSVAKGQERLGQNRFNRSQTNLAGVVSAGAPPAGFDGVTASDADLAVYGLPPRPNEARDPKVYAAWKRAITAEKQRVMPQLKQTNVFHGSARRVVESTGTSSNWSAIVDYSGAKSYNYSNSFYYISAEYVVPAATQAYGACTGDWDYSSTWVGLDGSNSDDVLQAGTESDAFCSGGSTTPFYSAWYEWYPYGEVQISNFLVSPGDDLFVDVWNTSPTQGFAYFLDYTTNQSVELEFTPPPGTSFI